ncbi:hypothetical protein C0991_008654 [Blastosporella zonata]|nr:hypothetical protein C0991_008654 [Blastosporella zonata]
MPQLHSLHLHVPTFPSFDSFPWRQLKHLELHIRNFIIEYAELLRLLTNLETCVLDLRIDSTSVIPHPTNTTTYHHLRFLDLSIYDDRDLDHDGPALWDLTLFPSLETLIHTSPQLYPSTPYPSTTLVLALYDFNPENWSYQWESQGHYLSHLPPTLKRLAIEFSNQGQFGDDGLLGDRKQVQPIVESLSRLERLSELALAVYVGRSGRTLVAEGVVDVMLGWERALRSRTSGYENLVPEDEVVLEGEQPHTLTLFGIGDEESVEKFFGDVYELYLKDEDGSAGVKGGVAFNKRKLGVWRVNMGKAMGWVE